jgi:DNA-binding beta-propeller fold protein YncE
MGAHAGLAVRAAAAAALVSAGLAGCTAAASGQAPGPPASTRDAGGPASGTSQDPPVTVYVIADGAVVAIRAATGTPGRVIRAGIDPDAIAVTPDGTTAYVTNGYYNGPDVIPINTATLTAGPGLTVGDRLTGVAVTPDGKTAYVLSYETGTAIPISTATGKPGAAISLGGAGAFPTAIAITPDGKTAYVPVTTSRGEEMVIPIDTASGTVGKPIRVGTSAAGGCDGDVIAITPDGKTAYVTN